MPLSSLIAWVILDEFVFVVAVFDEVARGCIDSRRQDIRQPS